MAQTGYIKGLGIWYRAELSTIKKKSDVPLQPVFEAFTNSLESINIYRERNNSADEREISIKLYLIKDLFSSGDKVFSFQKITISDNGIGFDNGEFQRFVNLRDNRKNFNNKGTGRVQILHSFDKTKIDSIYKDDSSATGYKKRIITLSKNDAFLAHNSLIRLDFEDIVESQDTLTTITLETLLNSSEEEFFRNLTAHEIKDELIRHYLAGFCENRISLPKISIQRYIDNKPEPKLEINSADIPSPVSENTIEIFKSKVEGVNIVRTSIKESFNLKSFIINKSELDKNALKLVSKGEVAKEIKLDNLLPTDDINGNRYLFLLSGTYIDDRDSDERGEIRIHKRNEFRKRNANTTSSEEEILLEDIEDKTNSVIVSLFKEIEEKSHERDKSIEELRKMFLLNPQTIRSLQNKIHIGDSDDTILKKIYEADAKVVAAKDAEIKQRINDIDSLSPTDDDYQEKLTEKVNDFVRIIPLQNRTALTQYVARRKMVLELFDKILKKELLKLRNGQRIDEDLLHNLIFQQHSDRTEDSDLWLINEEFIYFKGTSESLLGSIKLDDVNIIKEELTDEENEYRLKQQGNAKLKRTDILLFPKEGKCIIIELKAPDINISDHLNQINRYASLINNLSKDEFKFSTYYGYLIGENIDVDDIEDNDTDFKSAQSFNYIFRPYKRIAGKFGKEDGALYTEVIKYSTLLERATLRNKIFIEKLEKEI